MRCFKSVNGIEVICDLAANVCRKVPVMLNVTGFCSDRNCKVLKRQYNERNEQHSQYRSGMYPIRLALFKSEKGRFFHFEPAKEIFAETDPFHNYEIIRYQSAGTFMPSCLLIIQKSKVKES